MLNVEEAAEKVGRSKWAIYAARRRGSLPTEIVGGSIAIRLSDLMAWADRSRPGRPPKEVGSRD